MIWLDNDPAIIRWMSEEISIPYINPWDGRTHRYFPDFLIEYKSKSGTVKRAIIEVKPAAQCHAPVKPKRQSKRYIEESMTWGVNEAKWKAAKEFCLDNGMEFIIADEYTLGISKRKN